MFKLLLTENTYNSLKSTVIWEYLQGKNSICYQKNEMGYILSCEPTVDSVDTIYRLILFIYHSMPNENNKWIFSGQEFSISDEVSIKLFLLRFEGTDNYPLRLHILSDIIRKKELCNLQQVRALSTEPFSGILSFDDFDRERLLFDEAEQISRCINVEQQKLSINNRYIQNDFKIVKGEVNFRNCIIDGDIEIGGSSKVQFSQCIITGKVTCYDCALVYFSSVNMKQLNLYNSDLEFLRFEYCKIYRFIFHSCTAKSFQFDSCKVIEPYIASIKIPSTSKINMAQFALKNISNKTIRKVKKDVPVKIKNEDEYYLTFMFREPNEPITPKDIALNMVETVLIYGDLDKDHRLYSNMRYKKALYSNTGWRHLFVFLTGAFYIPSRWILYVALNTILFTALYFGIPAIQFINNRTNTIGTMNFWTALYYSICQLIGSNPTHLSPVGIAQICTTVQALLNTVFIANLFASLTRKFMRDEI